MISHQTNTEFAIFSIEKQSTAARGAAPCQQYLVEVERLSRCDDVSIEIPILDTKQCTLRESNGSTVAILKLIFNFQVP